MHEDVRGFEAKATAANRAALGVLKRGAPWSGLRAITGGIATCSRIGQSLAVTDTGMGDGSFDFNLRVNFGARLLNGGFSNIAVPSLSLASASRAVR